MLIDLDDSTTWPPELRATAERLWADARPSIDPDGDMDQLRDLVADEIDESLAGHELLVFHTTRLLPHENELVLRNGIHSRGSPTRVASRLRAFTESPMNTPTPAPMADLAKESSGVTWATSLEEAITRGTERAESQSSGCEPVAWPEGAVGLEASIRDRFDPRWGACLGYRHGAQHVGATE